MKKTITIIIAVVCAVLLFAGCSYKGYDFIDTNYHFNRAVVRMPDGEVTEIKITKWADAAGEQLTITDTEGNRFLIHSANCILIEDGDGDG